MSREKRSWSVALVPDDAEPIRVRSACSVLAVTVRGLGAIAGLVNAMRVRVFTR